MRAMSCGALALLGALSACDSDLPDYHRLDRLRILGMGAEPAWAGPGEPVRLSALVSSPRAGPTNHRWSWCPEDTGPNAEHRCSAVPEAPWPSTELGSEAVAELALPRRALIEQLCASLDAGCPEEQLVLYVRLEVSDGVERLVGLREVVVDLLGRRNGNPTIEAVTASNNGQKSSLESGSVVPLGPRDVRLELRASTDSAELYNGTREQLTVSWFVDTGELEFDRSRPEGPNAIATNVWMLEDSSSSQGSLHVVLRDGRGGTSWAQFSVEVVR